MNGMKKAITPSTSPTFWTVFRSDEGFCAEGRPAFVRSDFAGRGAPLRTVVRDFTGLAVDVEELLAPSSEGLIPLRLRPQNWPYLGLLTKATSKRLVMWTTFEEVGSEEGLGAQNPHPATLLRVGEFRGELGAGAPGGVPILTAGW